MIDDPDSPPVDPQRGGVGHRWRDLSLRGKVLVAFVLPVVIVLIDCAALVVAVSNQTAADRANTAATSIRVASNDLLVELLNAETGVRGYLASGQQQFIDPYELAVRQLPAATQRLDAMTDLPAARGHLKRVDALTTAEMSTLALVRDSAPGAERTTQLLQGKGTMDKLRAELADIDVAERAAVAAQSRRSTRNRRIALVTAFASVPLSIVGVLACVLLLTAGMIRRIRTVEAKSVRLGAGESLTAPDGGGDEIGRLDTALHRAETLLVDRDLQRADAVETANAAKDEAQRANAAKSQFLSRMSHELRTPLNAVLGFAQLLEMELTDPSERQSVAHILAGGNHLLELINVVLDLTAAEGRHMPLEIDSVDLASVLADSIALMAPIAAQHGVSIDSGTANTTGCVLADEHRLKQVLLNLIANAIKYNRPDGAVTITTEHCGDEVLRLLIHDTGMGIAEENLANLFTPFDRLGAERLLIDGTGLGLTVSKQLVEAMHGSIGVSSSDGVGTTVWITLPVSPVPATRALTVPTQAPRTPASGTPHTRKAHTTVIYIEDNLSNLLLIERLLTAPMARGEITLIPAQLGQLGIDLSREHQPDLIFLDLQLPDIPGAEVLHQLRFDPRTQNIPVVILTADARPDERHRLLNAGAHAYLAKPLRLPDLLSVIGTIAG